MSDQREDLYAISRKATAELENVRFELRAKTIELEIANEQIEMGRNAARQEAEHHLPFGANGGPNPVRDRSPHLGVKDNRLVEIVNDADNFYRPEIKSMAQELLELRLSHAGLLEALKMVLGKMDDWNQDGPTIRQIKAAIAKAEGQP